MALARLMFLIAFTVQWMTPQPVKPAIEGTWQGALVFCLVWLAVAVATVVESLRGPHREHYLERVYTAREVADCRDPSGAVDAERLAARFAAKEATIKALPGSGEEIPLSQIEVVRDASGSVALELSGRAAELLAGSGSGDLAVSLTHEAGFAAATVVIA